MMLFFFFFFFFLLLFSREGTLVSYLKSVLNFCMQTAFQTHRLLVSVPFIGRFIEMD